MAVRKRGKWWYGDAQPDIRIELLRYGELNGYVPAQFADAICKCRSTMFHLKIDEKAGVAIRTCTQCRGVHPIGDSDEYLGDATLEETACVCGGEDFEITIGVALYLGSMDVRWIYIGCRCPACGLVACYGDWKNEFIDYRKLLAKV